MTAQAAAPAVDILGVRVADLGRAAAVAAVHRALSGKIHTRIAFLNAHCANIAVSDPGYLRSLSDFLVLPDGIGVELAARMLRGSPFRDNLNGTDFVPLLLQEIDMPLTIGLLGARPGIGRQAVARLASTYPAHRFVDLGDGFFQREEEPAVLQRIAELRPDLLLVGMGVPRQEKWVAANLTDSHCTVVMAVGALIDFLSGTIPRAPVWLRRARMEWVYRLLLEPRRMWRRYILGNPVFLLRVFRQKLRGERSAGQ